MGEKKKYKVFTNIFIVLFFIAIFFIRFSWFDQHFTHYDDIKVAQFTDFTTNLFEWNFRKLVQGGEIATKVYNLLCIFVAKIYNWLTYAMNFSKYWTYAPGQFAFTFALLPLAYDYSSIKFLGRFPSLVFGCIALIVCWKAAIKYTNSRKVAFATTCVVGFSWQSILYCMHMSNYESIILIGFLISYLLHFILKKKSNKMWAIGVSLMGIMTWFHYQTVCYFAGFMLVFIAIGLDQKESIKKIIIKTVVLCILFAIIVFPLTLFANMDGIPTWNKGIDDQYLYNMSFDLVYTIRFFFVNSCKVFKAMLSPVPLYTVAALVITIIYMLLFFYATVKGIRGYKEKKDLYYLTIFCWGVILVEYIFVFIGKFTLSPTRHSNVLIPVFTLLIMIGMYYLIYDSKIMNKVKALPYIFALCIMISWGMFAGKVKDERMDLYTTDSISELVREYKPDLIIDRFAPQLWYLLGDEYARRDIIDYQTDFYDRDFEASNNKSIMIMSSTNRIDKAILKEVSEQLIAKGYLTKELCLEQLSQEPIVKFEYQTNNDFDFYNVTEGSANNFYYTIYMLE